MKTKALYLICAGLAAAMMASPASAQSLQGTANTPQSLIGVETGAIPGVVWNGTALNGFTGGACSSAGDVDADGYSDILVGLPSWDNVPAGRPNIGQAYLIFGTPDSFASQPDQPLTPFSPVYMVQFVGADSNNQAGFSVSGAGDVNGDGYADFLISAPGFKENGGMIYLIYGAPRYLWTQRIMSLGSAAINPYRQTRIFGGAAGLRAGWSVSGAGDVNGDGFDDIVIGIPFGNGGTGEAVVLFGQPEYLSPNGTIDLGTFSYGPSSGLRLRGFRPGSTTGWSVSGVADFNFDGKWDILIGAPFAAGVQSGGLDEAYLVFGSTFDDIPNGIFELSELKEDTGLRLYHPLDVGIGLGYSVSGIGDFSQDGICDVALGAPFYNQDQGRCFVIFGNMANPGGAAAAQRVVDINADVGGEFFTELPGLRAGFSVSGAGDVNNDGVQDLLIGGPGVTPPTQIPTRAWLVYGQDFIFADGPVDLDMIDSINWGQTYLERNTRVLGGQAGYSVAGAGDFNRDNLFDLLIGSPGNERCYLVYGVPLTTPFGYQIHARNSDTPPLPVGIIGDGSHALPLTRCWIDFNSGNMDPETLIANVYFYTWPYQIYPYLTRTRYSWYVSAFRQGATDTRFIVKGTQTFGATAWYDTLFWSSGGTEYDWLNFNQDRDPLRALISVDLPFGSEFYDLATVPSVIPPRIVKAILVDLNDNGVADPNEQLVLVFNQAVNQLNFMDQSDFFLPVKEDSLGTLNFNVYENISNRRQLILNLGQGVKITIPGAFDIQAGDPGSPSGIDLIVSPDSPNIASVFGVPAVDNGEVGVNDDAVDMKFDYVGSMGEIGPGGGVIGLLPSLDAEFTGHQLTIPPDGVEGSGAALQGLLPVFQMSHPPLNFGVVNAVQVMVDRDNFSFSKSATLRLQILDDELDMENGFDKRAARIHQFMGNQWVLVPGTQMVDVQNNFVEVEITDLNSFILLPGADRKGADATGASLKGIGSSIGIFGNIFGETVEEATFIIKPAAGGAALVELGLAENPTLKPGLTGAYTLHEIEFPGYQMADPTDPLRIQVKIRKPNLFDVYTTHGTHEIPGDLTSYFIVETRNAMDQPVAFASPVNFKIQFFDKTINTYDDRIKFDGSPGEAANMKLFGDLRDGDDNEYDLIPNQSPTILPAAGGGVMQVLSVPNLTGTSGLKLWGAISTDPPNVRHGWMLR